MNFLELIDKLPPEDRQIVIDHFVRQMTGLDTTIQEIRLRRTAKISMLGTEEEMLKEIAANTNIPIELLANQNIFENLKLATTRHLKAESITADFKQFLTNNHARKDKFEELIDLGNFLAFLESNYYIAIPEKVESVPDFIIVNENKKIGIEHTRLINSESKILIKETINILQKAETILLKRNNDLKLIVNISINYWKMNLGNKSLTRERFSIQEKNEIAEQIANYIESLILNKEISKPSFIDNVSISSLSEHPLSFELNESYLGKSEYEIPIVDLINSKEEKFISYSKEQTFTELWLLIVINGVSAPSSYVLSDKILSENFSSQFDKIFLLDGFSHECFMIYSKKGKA